MKTPADIWAEVCAKAAHDHQARLDFFAAAALAGLMVRGDWDKPLDAAEMAYDCAEAMVVERAKRSRT